MKSRSKVLYGMLNHPKFKSILNAEFITSLQLATGGLDIIVHPYETT